jgi:hypothetical protein
MDEGHASALREGDRQMTNNAPIPSAAFALGFGASTAITRNPTRPMVSKSSGGIVSGPRWARRRATS